MIKITIRRTVVKTNDPAIRMHVYVLIMDWSDGSQTVEVHDNDITLARSMHNGIIDNASSIPVWTTT